MTDSNERDDGQTDVVEAQAVIDAFTDMPILSRLEFVKNLLVGHGGERRNVESDPALVIATEILKETIDVVKDWPKMTKWPAPEP
jgi:hypothetical protein